MRLGHLQVDNQLPFTPFPSLLYPVPELDVSENGRLGEQADDMSSTCLALELEQDLSYTEIVYIRHMSLYLTPLDINVDGMLAAALLGMAMRYVL